MRLAPRRVIMATTMDNLAKARLRYGYESGCNIHKREVRA